MGDEKSDDDLFGFALSIYARILKCKVGDGLSPCRLHIDQRGSTEMKVVEEAGLASDDQKCTTVNTPCQGRGWGA